MGNGIQPYGGPGGVPLAGPVAEEKIQESKPREVKQEAQPNAGPSVSDPHAQKLEQRLNGAARQAELQRQFGTRQPGESLEAARKILENPHLSSEAKISQLQKTIQKADKAEFAIFMTTYPTFSSAQKELINSAITESPAIMERIGTELSQSQQLAVISESVLYPLRGNSVSEAKKRLERADKGIAAWMEKTDPDTLNKALSGRTINEIKVSGKLFGALASDPAKLIKMGQYQSKLYGDNLTIAMEVMNMALESIKRGLYSRDDIEAGAQSLILKSAQDELRKNSNRF